ncbi:hypothetical protein D9M72_270630 [compost metagenome]
MLRFSQAPVLAAGTEDGFQTLAKLLLVALQVHQQAAALVQFGSAGQFFQALGELLFALGQGTGLATGLLDHAQLLLVAAFQGAHLPETPATHGDAGGAQQQGEQRQTIAPWGRRGAGRGYGFGGYSVLLLFRGFCFAHVSILRISGPAPDTA